MTNPTEPNKKTVSGTKVLSYVVIAIALLALLDVGARLTWNYWPIDHYNSPNRSWVWWAIKDFRGQKQAPDVVLMGSSLMMNALHGGDSTHYNRPENAAFHHRSYYFEELMKKKDQDIRTFAFAIGGQMASDAYVISSRLLTGDMKPKTIVYGIAPRDFMDNTLASPASTETFRYVGRIKDLSDEEWDARKGFWERVEHVLTKASFLYQKRLDFVYLQNEGMKQLLSSLGIKMDLNHAPFELRGIALVQLPEDTGPSDLCFTPYDKKQAKYADNLDQYRYRYLPFKPKVYYTQLSYLEKLMKFAKDNGIEMVLVNMPITKDNMDIMPANFYNIYKKDVLALVGKYNAQIIDLNNQKRFPKEYFEDSVHLNGLGAVNFFEVLADKFSSKSAIAHTKNTNI